MPLLKWFKEHNPFAKKQEEIEQVLSEFREPLESPIKAHVRVNDSLSGLFKDGTLFSSSNIDEETYKLILGSGSQEMILKLMEGERSPEEVAKEEKTRIEKENYENRQKGLKFLEAAADFEIDGDIVRLVGVNRSMPELLVDRFIQVLSESNQQEYDALKRFWYWTCLNPRAEVADMLFDFLSNNCLRLNQEGFFYALRNVVTVGANKALVEFISNAYNKVKAVWKKKPINYQVWQSLEDKTYHIFKGFPTDGEDSYLSIGNLNELYTKLPEMEENRYTDAYTKTFDIRVGQKVSMRPEDCSWSTADCMHAGLHFTMDEINYVGCGDTSVLVLINPSKVVGIGTSKGRCYEYFPIMTVPRSEVTEILHDMDFDTLQLDSVYAQEELENLEQRVKEGFAIEAKKHSFNIPSITSEEIKSIAESLTSMKDKIKERVKIYA